MWPGTLAFYAKTQVNGKRAFRDKIAAVHEIDMTADELVAALLGLAASETVCLLDSCGVRHLGSHLLIAGIDPVETLEISHADSDLTLSVLDEKLSGERAAVFTISYDFGLKLLGLGSQTGATQGDPEPDLFLSSFEALIVHDYDTGKTFLTGDSERFDRIREKLVSKVRFRSVPARPDCPVSSNFTRASYLAAIETIKERIRRGDTYQTNLTQQLSVNLSGDLTPAIIFERLRARHPAPFAAFIVRPGSTVVSASPERFIKVGGDTGREISTSPIKGTRRRGSSAKEDASLRRELLSSKKDRAENTMIVDLLRNDLGRVCEYGSVRVEKLCDLEEHPTLFHLVSTVTGKLRESAKPSDILKAVFPCGSITGAPKISTMRIIDEIETAARGLSMGAIGYYVPGHGPRADHRPTWDLGLGTRDSVIDLSVAIRTMVIRGDQAIFNVGGGIVIDSDPESEYQETLLKARALLTAVGTDRDFRV